MIFKQIKFQPILAAVLVLSLATGAQAATNRNNGEGDPRIKTLVYSESDVFTIVARNGFQTDIELGQNETIDTISIGDSIGWQITPAVRRIFIKPLQKNGVTNLSVITNKRSYQFELVAANSNSNIQDHSYVVRFYYPDENGAAAPIDRSRGSMRPVSPTAIPELPVSVPTAPTPPAAPALPGSMAAAPAASYDAGGNNFNYTLTGPDQLAPSKIYDDGKATYFQFKSPAPKAPKFAVVRPDGSEVPVASRRDKQGHVIIDQMASKISIKDGSNTVYVFNEKMNLPPLPSTRPY